MEGVREGYEEITEEPCIQTLSYNQDDQEKLRIIGFRENRLKKWCFYTVTILLGGVPLLLMHWYPQCIYLKHSRTSFRNASYVLVKDSYDVYSTHPVRTIPVSGEALLACRKCLGSAIKVGSLTKYFIHKDIRYICCHETKQFYQLRGWDNGIKMVNELLEESFGYTAQEQQQVLQLYGRNEIKIVVKSYWKLLRSEIVHPFYLFQLFSVVVWSVDEYVYYAICVIVTTLFTVCMTLYSAKQQLQSLQNLVKKSAVNKVRVVRKDGDVEEIDSWMLVPGDIIEIPVNGCVMACDAVILNGNCIVNESTLTGESAPVTKTPPPSTVDAFDSVIFKRHTLFCGTEVVQTRYYGGGRVKAITINTGFSTRKGELVRSILHPKPIGFKFYEDSLKFVSCLFLLATMGIVYLLWVYLGRGIDWETFTLNSLDLITIVVPPALPAAMTAGIVYARSRLLTKGIFCISPPKINVCGKLKLLCFDKTGTLTEEGMNLWGVVQCSKDSTFGEVSKDLTKMDPTDPLVVAMAACHSLTRISGKLSGDPLDLSIFNSINWDLEEQGNDVTRYDLICPTVVRPKNYEKRDLNMRSASVEAVNLELENCKKNKHLSDPFSSELPYEIGIVREFPFTSADQCMSVITRRLGEKHMRLFCKGAPDRIRDLCVSESLPETFGSVLQGYTSAGFRVLGVAYKNFDAKFNWRKSQRVKRDEVEHGLVFLGLLIMQNTLKKKSIHVIKELKAADIRCVMITGDNLLTAISVSRECLMVLPEETVIEVNITQAEDPKKMPLLTFTPVNAGDKSEQIMCPTGESLELVVSSSKYHYALDGKTWTLLRSHFPELVPFIIVRGTVFARMLPEQKTQVVEAFQDLDYIVGMCGDGANDCGAMKAAHVGVSLSEAESSVAAPFTSKIPDISCVVGLVKEGRCALISSFVIFKYMAMYSLIQFISVLILYTKGIALGNMEFLYIDLVITTSLAVVIGRTGPAKNLVKSRPIARLVSPANVIPLLLQILLTFLIQVSSLHYLYLQDWFEPISPTSEDETICWENTVVYCVSSFQYLILALVYSKGKPYRQSFYRDIPFMAVFVSLLAFTVLLTVYPVHPVGEFFELMPVEADTKTQAVFRIKLLAFPLVNLILSFLIEASVANRKWLKKFIHSSIHKTIPKNRYKQVLMESTRHCLIFDKMN